MTRENIMRLIPEFSLLHDTDIRDKCIDIWAEVLTDSTWEMQGLIEKCPTALLALRDDCPEDMITHTRRVTRLCSLAWEELDKDFFEKIGPCNREYLIAAALIHDVGKYLEYEPKDGSVVLGKDAKLYRHPITGAYLGKKYNLPSEVIYAVMAHSTYFSPGGANATKTAESVILKALDEMVFDYARIFWSVE